MTSKVLVRVDEENVPWIMNKPTGGWGEYGEPVTWSFFARLEGWEIGDRYKDGHSEGFWILLLNADVLPPGHGGAVGVDVVGLLPVGRDVLFAVFAEIVLMGEVRSYLSSQRRPSWLS